MKTCKYINNTLIFTSDNITPCYSCFSNKAPFYFNFNIKEYENINFKEKKQEILKKINSENIKSFPCYKCCQLTEYEETPSKYTHIILSFWNNITLKLTADKTTGLLLGGQAVGAGDADKRINALTGALIGRLTVYEFTKNDLTYAPPFSPTIDPLLNAAQLLLEKIKKD